MNSESVVHQLTILYQEWHAVILVFATVVGALIVGAVLRVFLSRISARLTSQRHVWSHAVLSAIALPVQVLVWVLGIALAGQFLLEGGIGGADSVLAHGLKPCRDVITILVVMWALLRIVSQLQLNMAARAHSKGRELDPTAADAIGKLTKAAVVIVSILTIMQSLGFSIAGLLAFGGMGGIAVGFAAQSLVANLLGGLTIFASRPFKVGEYIILPGTDLMGGVEHIGWRATRLMGFDCKPFYVPNAMFNTQPVINHTRMTSRRIMEDIHVRYADIDVVRDIVADTKAMLMEHPGVKHDFFAFNFDSCGAYSLKFSLYAFTVSIDYNVYMDVKEDVLIKLTTIIRNHGAELAGPMSTVNMPQLAGSASARERITDRPLPPVLAT